MNIFKAVAVAVSLLLAPATPTIDAKPTPQTPLDSWLDKLAWCESRNDWTVINHDDGGSPSYGYLQFKKGTFLTYSRKFNTFPDTEDAELMNLIMDKDAQLRLAKEIIIHDYAWGNWTNCTKVIGTPPKG